MLGCCASCGKSDGKLKTCTACQSVKYCNVECQRNHRKAHKKDCNASSKEAGSGGHSADRHEGSGQGGCFESESDRETDQRRKLEELKHHSKTIKQMTGPGDPLRRELHRVISSIKEDNLQETSSIAADLEALKSEIMTGEDDDDDDDLFKSPPPKQDCPICFAPIPADRGPSSYATCCGKMVCGGCKLKEAAVLAWKNAKRVAKEKLPAVGPTCSFCRGIIYLPHEEHLKKLNKRMADDDARAFYVMAMNHAEGKNGLPRDEEKACELFFRAVELDGSAEACAAIADRYREGESLGHDHSKYMHYVKLAAKGGHDDCRNKLGLIEYEEGNFERAVNHWVISASAGDDKSLHNIRQAYRNKHATKIQFEKALRAHQKAREEMSSEERDMAKRYHDAGDDWSVFNQTELAKLCGVPERDRDGRLFSLVYEAHQKDSRDAAFVRERDAAFVRERAREANIFLP